MLTDCFCFVFRFAWSGGTERAVNSAANRAAACSQNVLDKRTQVC